MKKTRRVADESMYGDGGGAVPELPIMMIEGGAGIRRPVGRRGISVILGIVRAPLSLLSWLSSDPAGRINGGADGVWASGEMGLMSEMNHLMINDSMRYAILL
ncbi:uncharacterized protein LOC124928802 [Impatiens glandulifera]|uniref:uncharacterized protein LOC124928802 n=1 Tax=Impatiens glandulifera TaxID=253017 RepID=UPI001FB0AC7D|nr:uncharacterized protein LOC124928802 [Impatiens glandulifera]